jgi:4-diphosphocytidyl-2-C-methyl-D-erythritol kinase
MICFPNAKINLGLNITSKRSDGYHNIDSCFYPVQWRDVLEIIPSKTLKFTSSGIPIPGNEENNLCLEAYRVLAKQFNIAPVHIHLHKVIPIGAGLGGGSADGAFALKMLNDIYQLSLSVAALETFASQLGSDCPFFITNQPRHVTGTGNVFHNIKTALSRNHLVIIKPDIHVSTAQAYSGIHPAHPTKNSAEIIENEAIDNWKDALTNDFEQSIFPTNPSIAKIKQQLYSQGAIYASMTGSGAAVYGIFEEDIEIVSEHPHVWKGPL